MSHEFEPDKPLIKNNEFSAWEYVVPQAEEKIEVNPEEEFIKECNLLREQAKEQGYAAGIAAAQEEIELKKAQLENLLHLVKKPVQLLDEQLCQEIIQTIIALSQHCISVELSVNPVRLKYVLEEITTQLATAQGKQILYMHPDDVYWIKSETKTNTLHDLLVGDASLQRGDFYLKGEHSELDGRLQTRFTTLFSKYINKDAIVALVSTQD